MTMSNRDLTAPSSQARSELSTEARELGGSIYRKIVDEGDEQELHKLQLLARASERMEKPVEIQTSERPRTAGLLNRLLTGVGP